MSTECLNMIEETISCDSAPASAPGSPKNRVKFLCSHGGKILPRPADGHLKYVGGETRVISVHRDIKLTELMKKLTYLIEEEVVLKYQLLPEDLDALVSVKNEEDLRHMFSEHDLYESAGSPRLRAFLFPAKPIFVENHVEIHVIEQRYIDAINGIVRSPTLGVKNHLALNIYQGASLGMSSACSSPRSPDSCYAEANLHEALLQNGFHSNRSHMHRVQSSPSVCNLTGLQQSGFCVGHQMHHPQSYYQPSSRHHPPQGSYYSSKPPIDHHNKGSGPERLISVRSMGRSEGSRFQVDYVPQPYQPVSRHSGGGGCCPKCMHHDDYGPPSFDRRTDRGSNLSPSPLPLSPRYGHGQMHAKPWDSAMGWGTAEIIHRKADQFTCIEARKKQLS